MNKIICVIMAILMLFVLVGRGGSATTAETSETAKTATFVINNIEISDQDSSPFKVYIGLYSKDLNKEIFIKGSSSDYSSFYCQYTEGDYVKITWEEDKTGEVIKSSLIFEKVSNELVPIEDVGGG